MRPFSVEYSQVDSVISSSPYCACEKSHEIIKKAEDRSREMYRVANEYTEDALRRTEEAIQMALEEVKQSRVRFRAASAEQMQKRREELAQSAEKQTQNG